MGNYKERERKSGKCVMLSTKRKSRRQMLRRWHKSHKMKPNMRTVRVEDKTQLNINEHFDANIRAWETSTSPTLSPETGKASMTKCQFSLTGRRIFNVEHLFQQIFAEKHSLFGCNITDMKVVSEKRKGLISIFTLKCQMCGINSELSTAPENDSNMNINSAVTLATTSVGVGYSQSQELMATLNVPYMASTTFDKYLNDVSTIIDSICYKSIEEAGRIEAEMAKEAGDINEEGIPFIAVVADGAWSKRSYNVNYSASSGVGCIIGYRTRKIVFIGIRNKYCYTCDKWKHSDVPQHECFKNWNGTSTSMESDIILEGFKKSLEMHGVIYSQLIGDGDSSVHKKLLQYRPYGTFLVEKIECKNHLLRNYCSKLRGITMRRMSSSKNISVSPFLRKSLFNRISRLRNAVAKASQFRMLEAGKSFNEKCSSLASDILNSVSHTFGEHEKCSEINYFQCNPSNGDQNLVPDMRRCGLYEDIENCMNRLIQHAGSLLKNMNNNSVEQYNSIVSKFVGGKRVDFSKKRQYQTRCRAAAVSYNSEGNYHKVMHEALVDSSPDGFKQKYIARINRRRQSYIKRQLSGDRTLLRRKKTFQLPDDDYGLQTINASQEDLGDNIYKQRKVDFLTQLSKTQQEISKLELDTRGQSLNQLWKQERSVRLTASYFGGICKMRPLTRRATKVKYLLYSQFSGNAHTRYGTENELLATKQIEKDFSAKVSQCGLYVHPYYCFLGASPDGLINDETIIEIKCPSTAKMLHPVEAIQQGKIKFATYNPTTGLTLKENHDYFYQVQGNLEVCDKTECLFVIWTPKGTLTQRIRRNTDFWKHKMLPSLMTFYMKHLLPELVDPRYPRGLDIRE